MINYFGIFLWVLLEKGLIFLCWDIMYGYLILKLREVRDSYLKLILEVCSELCGLEVGGGFWE